MCHLAQSSMVEVKLTLCLHFFDQLYILGYRPKVRLVMFIKAFSRVILKVIPYSSFYSNFLLAIELKMGIKLRHYYTFSVSPVLEVETQSKIMTTAIYLNN